MLVLGTAAFLVVSDLRRLAKLPSVVVVVAGFDIALLSGGFLLMLRIWDLLSGFVTLGAMVGTGAALSGDTSCLD